MERRFRAAFLFAAALFAAGYGLQQPCPERLFVLIRGLDVNAQMWDPSAVCLVFLAEAYMLFCNEAILENLFGNHRYAVLLRYGSRRRMEHHFFASLLVETFCSSLVLLAACCVPAACCGFTGAELAGAALYGARAFICHTLWHMILFQMVYTYRRHWNSPLGSILISAVTWILAVCAGRLPWIPLNYGMYCRSASILPGGFCREAACAGELVVIGALYFFRAPLSVPSLEMGGMEINVEKTVMVEQVSKAFRTETVLKDVSLMMEPGKIYGLTGKNGSGKTVLMKCICGFLKVTSGSIYVNGKQVGVDVDFPREIGAVIETPEFIRYLSGYENLRVLAGINHTIDDTRIRETMETVGLDWKSKKAVGRYSLGMRQRLGIAQAIMEDPEILILDEPFNSLDETGVVTVRSILTDLKKKGKTILLASHIHEDIRVLCDEVYEMKKGTLEKC